MADKKRVYWDACSWLGLINQEAAKVAACQYVMQQAESGKVEIWTSAFTLAEVFKKKCDDTVPAIGLPAAQDVDFEDFLKKDFVIRVMVDDEVGTEARRLLRTHGGLIKPQDAIHLATAVINSLDELHTYDGTNLIKLNGLIKRRDGITLVIGPPVIPPPPEIENPPPSLFDAADPPEGV